MKQTSLFILLLLTALSTTSCGHKTTSEKELITTTADSFATAFYNFNYKKALVLCDSDSKNNVYFIAGSLGKKDLEIIRQATKKATISISDVSFNDEDSTATVSLTVKDFFKKDSVGVPGHFIEKATYILPLRKDNGRWLVRFRDMR